MAKIKCMYPYPVYHAHFDNGAAPAWALFVPADSQPETIAARGRHLAQTFARLGSPLTPHYGAALFHGYVEDRRYPGQAWHADDLSVDLDSPAKARRVTKKDWQAMLAEVLRQSQNGGLKASTIAQARELIAA